MIAERPRSFAYHPTLDGVRAILLFGVMSFHAGLPIPAIGSGGMLVFFVLSGFLITSLLLTEWFNRGFIDLGRFYLRRVLRLYPALLLVLIVTVGVVPLFIRVPAPSTLGVVSMLFYFSNSVGSLIGTDADRGYLPHLWSLSVEEQFYLVCPAVLIFFLRRRNASRNLLLVAVAIAAFVELARAVLELNRAFYSEVLNSYSGADHLMFGSALAVAIARYPDRLKVLVQKWAWPALVVIVVVVAPWPLSGPLLYVRDTAGVALYGVAAAILIGFLHFANPRSIAVRIMSFGPMVQIGRMSYGAYLWHFPVFVTVRIALHQRSVSLGEMLLEFAITLGVATLSFVFLESPILRLKDRLKPAVRAPIGAAVAEAG